MFFVIASFSCSKKEGFDYKVISWEVDYGDLKSRRLVDTVNNLSSKHNLQGIYLIESLLDSTFLKLNKSSKIEMDKIELNLIEKGYGELNSQKIEILKIVFFKKQNPITEEFVIYNPDVGILMYTHSHTRKRFYKKQVRYITKGEVQHTSDLEFNNDEILEFYFSDIDIPQIESHENSEFEDSIVLDIDFQ